MAEKDPDPFAEKLLRATLARYSEAAPPPGLEERVLARLRSENALAAFGWSRAWKFGMALAVAALLAAMSTMYVARRAARPPASRPVVAVNPSVRRETGLASDGLTVSSLPASEKPTVRKALPVASHAHHRAAERANAEPRLAVFPSPAPMTAQEKLLIEYARHGPPPTADPFKEEMDRMAKLGLELPSDESSGQEPSTRRN